MILTPQFTILSIHDKDDITEQVCFSLTVCGCGEGVNVGVKHCYIIVITKNS